MLYSWSRIELCWPVWKFSWTEVISFVDSTVLLPIPKLLMPLRLNIDWARWWPCNIWIFPVSPIGSNKLDIFKLCFLPVRIYDWWCLFEPCRGGDELKELLVFKFWVTILAIPRCSKDIFSSPLAKIFVILFPFLNVALFWYSKYNLRSALFRCELPSQWSCRSILCLKPGLCS